MPRRFVRHFYFCPISYYEFRLKLFFHIMGMILSGVHYTENLHNSNILGHEYNSKLRHKKGLDSHLSPNKNNYDKKSSF